MVVAIIIIAVIIAAVIGYVAMNPSVLGSLRDSTTSINPIDMTQSFVAPARGEPIAIYNYCHSYIRGDFPDDRYDSIETECYDRSYTLSTQYKADKIADFKFTLPPQLDDLITIRAPSTVYQYADNDFEFGLFDEVGEKRYDVKLWELPN